MDKSYKVKKNIKNIVYYLQLARQDLEKDKVNKARAIGAAVKHNPISLIIPCHRVIGSNGSLTGYAGGLDRKRALLKMENPQIKFSQQLAFL